MAEWEREQGAPEESVPGVGVLCRGQAALVLRVERTGRGRVWGLGI